MGERRGRDRERELLKGYALERCRENCEDNGPRNEHLAQDPQGTDIQYLNIF